MGGSSPVELRVGSTGAGAFVGCGAGIGIVAPVSLHAVPVVGQLASSLSASLGSLNAATGGVGAAARQRVRSLGVRGLDVGVGCGAMVGYGFGAGLMLKPNALQSLSLALQSAGQRLVSALPPPLQAAVQQRQQQQQQQQHAAAVGTAPTAPPLPGLAANAATQQPQAQQALSGSGGGGDAAKREWQREQEQDMAALSRLVSRQQAALGDMQERLDQLQAAVCKLDAAAPGCKRK